MGMNTETDNNPPYRCQFCGAPSWIEPHEQSMPPSYCHESDHGEQPDNDLFVHDRFTSQS
jgi:hypothetical protein